MSDPTNPANKQEQSQLSQAQGCPADGGQNPGAACEPNHAQMQADAQNLGLAPGLFTYLLQTFGPLVAQALLQLLQRKQALAQQARGPAQAAQAPGQPGSGVQPTPQNWALDFSMARNLIVILLSTHRDEILGWLNEAEARTIDAIISKLQAADA